jgi:hypothetical protein|tara:strand:- start:315 stop:755 length:441 start_codon:yes stop_codon:yes gene_type:complete
MLYLDITGKAPRRRCRGIIEWFKAKYMPNHHLDITVAHRGLKREGAQGFCTVMDCDHRPREFLIEMETTLSEELYCQTLLHELWHVYQHVSGSLRDKRGVRHWKNVNADDLSYEDQPWEHEAMEMEKKLYNDYIGVKTFPNRLTNP